jgi:hypothetical protein
LFRRLSDTGVVDASVSNDNHEPGPDYPHHAQMSVAHHSTVKLASERAGSMHTNTAELLKELADLAALVALVYPSTSAVTGDGTHFSAWSR